MSRDLVARQAWSFLATLVVAACSSSPESPPQAVGVNDVLQACQLRTPWKNASSTACNDCIGLATTPPCACSDRDYSGKCNGPAAQKNREPSCEGVDTCVHTCDRTKCACIEACYAGKPTCRARASALDGCVVEICDPYCH